MTIKISIITATFNCFSTIGDCLSSVAMQNYSNKEHIVIDGVSTDGTIDLINRYLHQIDIFKSEPDSGIYDALNKGISLSAGDVIGFLHADDLYASDDVLSMVASAFADPSVCAVYGDLQYVNQKDTTKVIRSWKSKIYKNHYLAFGWMPAHPTLYVRRDFYGVIGGFDTSYRISADYLSILKLFSSANFNTIYLPHVLVRMRIGGESNKSIYSILRKSKEDWRALRSCDLNIFQSAGALVWKNLSKIVQFW